MVVFERLCLLLCPSERIQINEKSQKFFLPDFSKSWMIDETVIHVGFRIVIDFVTQRRVVRPNGLKF
jgi:hypothetical protein